MLEIILYHSDDSGLRNVRLVVVEQQQGRVPRVSAGAGDDHSALEYEGRIEAYEVLP